MTHLEAVPYYPRNPKILAREICNLRYDAMSLLFASICSELRTDSVKDYNARKTQLAKILEDVAFACAEASMQADNAWSICEPHMKE
jgi:hypothetical protein